MISAVERGFRPLDDDDEPPLDLRPSAFFKWLAAADVRDLSPPLVRTDTLLALSAILPDAATSISYADSRRSSSAVIQIAIKLVLFASNWQTHTGRQI